MSDFSTVFKACESNDVEKIEELLKYKTDILSVNHIEDGATPLHVASQFGSISVARLLIQAGASPSAQNNLGQRSLHLAIDDIETMELLLAHGASIDDIDNDGDSPLLVACSVENLESAIFLITRGANVNVQNLRLGNQNDTQTLIQSLT